MKKNMLSETTVSPQEDGSIVIKAAQQNLPLSALLEGITPENCHQETDWGRVEGKEIW